MLNWVYKNNNGQYLVELSKLLTKKLILPPVLNFVDCSRILINYLFVGFRALFFMIFKN